MRFLSSLCDYLLKHNSTVNRFIHARKFLQLDPKARGWNRKTLGGVGGIDKSLMLLHSINKTFALINGYK